MADRTHRDDRYLHGGARLEHRQCRAAAYCRQPVRDRRPGHLGADLIPRFQRHHPASGCMAVGGNGTQALLYDLRGALHGMLVSLWNRSLAWHAYRVSRHAGSWRWRTTAQRTSHPRRYFSTRTARYGVRHLWNGGGAGALDRTDSGRLDNRQLQLALDFLYQRSDRNNLAIAYQSFRPGSALP